VQKRLALAGASRSGRGFGNAVLKELTAKGYEVWFHRLHQGIWGVLGRLPSKRRGGPWRARRSVARPAVDRGAGSDRGSGIQRGAAIDQGLSSALPAGSLGSTMSTFSRRQTASPGGALRGLRT
jgi:hypothetical protein